MHIKSGRKIVSGTKTQPVSMESHENFCSYILAAWGNYGASRAPFAAIIIPLRLVDFSREAHHHFPTLATEQLFSSTIIL